MKKRCCHQTKFHHLVGHEVSEVEAAEIFDASTTSPGEETTDVARKIQHVGIDTGKLSCFWSFVCSLLMFAFRLATIGSLMIFVYRCQHGCFQACHGLLCVTLSLGFIISWSRLFHAHLKTCPCASNAAQMILDRRDT